MSIYMITDGHGAWLRRDAVGNYEPVKSRELGDMYARKDKAANVLKNCINKNLRSKYKVFEYDGDIITKQNSETPQEEEIKVDSSIIKALGDVNVDGNNLPNLLNKINSFSGFICEAEKRREELSTELSEIDQEINDINHYIEFGKFNAYQGWLAFNMLRVRLKKRRKIKDELGILVKLGECKVNSAMMRDIKSEIGNLGKREYHPRRLNELFR